VTPRLRRNLRPGAAAYLAADKAEGSAAWDQARWCVVDLEMSGLDPRHHEIISFGAIPIDGGRIQFDGAVSGLVRPSRPLTESSILIHGIRAADLSDAPLVDEAIDPLLAAMAGRTLVAHVAAVERAFLGRALRRQRLRLRGAVADSEVIARLWLCERDGAVPPRMSLHDLAHALGLPAHSEHDALGDALTAAQVFIATATHLAALGTETVRSLARAQHRLDAALTYRAH
jgi:DNA polymerase-3 subunit epsilon